MTKIEKFRPSLTLAQIDKIIYLCQHEEDMSASSLEILSVLIPFKAKIENKAINPSHTKTIKPSLEQSLGMNVTDELGSLTIKDKETLMSEAYIKFTAYRESCSVAEIELAQQYRYTNDLMSETEVDLYEKGLL